MVFLLMLLTLPPSQGLSYPTEMTDEILITLKNPLEAEPGIFFSQLLEVSESALKVEEIFPKEIFKIKLPISLPSLQRIQSHPLVEAASYNFEMEIGSEGDLPFNDPDISKCWWLRNTGANAIQREWRDIPHSPFTPAFPFERIMVEIPMAAAEGVDINVIDAWEMTTGSPDVTIAVIDLGVDLFHPDLRGAIAVNEAELHGELGVDDDHNEKTDDIYGWNFVYDDGDIFDSYGHGTAVSGIIAARGNNNEGIVGIAHTSKIIPIILFLPERFYRTSISTGDLFIKALTYAAERGAKVINCSFSLISLIGSSQQGMRNIIQTAINRLWERNIQIVAAAGNDNSVDAIYPAGFEHVLAVGGLNPENGRFSTPNFGSNYGEWVHISAPAMHIWTTEPRSLGHLSPYVGYNSFSGTSFATPMVSGAVALLQSLYPQLTAREITTALTHRLNTEPIASDQPIGRRLNILKALQNPLIYL